MALKPLDCRLEAATAQVQDQVDGAASPDTLGPVHELGAGNREGALIGVPFVRVAGVGQSAAKSENRRQRNRPQAIHPLLAPRPIQPNIPERFIAICD